MATTFTKTGNKASKAATLPKEIFGVEVADHRLLVQAYETQLANSRSNWAKSKTRADVRGGGRKPWRQKGLGRARVGSIRSPIWRGGGITFGPTGQENHRQKLNRSAAQKALTQALSLKASEKSVSVIETVEITDGKTKTLKTLLDKLKLTQGRTVIVTSETDQMLVRACRNLPVTTVTTAAMLNTKTVVDADQILFTKPAVDALKDRLGGKK